MPSQPPSPPPSQNNSTPAQQEGELPDLIRRAAAGDEVACTRLYELWREPILYVIRRRMTPPLRKMCDTVDVAQTVWRSFFNRIRDGCEFDDPERFLAFLVGIAQKKTVEQHRRLVETQKRSLAREEPIGSREGELLDRSGAGRDPAEQAAERDEEARLLAALSDRDRRIVESLRDGDRLEEVAQLVNLSVRQLRRILERRRNGLSQSEEAA